MPPFAASDSAATPETSSSAPVEIVSIDEISLDDVEIVSGGRTLRGNIQMAVSGRRLDIRRADFTADDTPISVTGRIDDPAGPTGELTIRGASLDVLRLVSFASDFSTGGMPSDARPSSPSAPDAVPMNLKLSLETERAVLGTLVLDALAGSARVTDEAVTLDPIAFGGVRRQGERLADADARRHAGLQAERVTLRHRPRGADEIRRPPRSRDGTL